MDTDCSFTQYRSSTRPEEVTASSSSATSGREATFSRTPAGRVPSTRTRTPTPASYFPAASAAAKLASASLVRSSPSSEERTFSAFLVSLSTLGA